jgi:hypothetical protein
VFYSGFCALHHSLFMAALAADDLWHDQFKCLPDPQHHGVPLDPVEKITGDIRDHRGCSNIPLLDV